MNTVKGDHLYSYIYENDESSSDSGESSSDSDEIEKIRKIFKQKNREWRKKYEGIKIKLENNEYGFPTKLKIMLRRKNKVCDVEEQLDQYIDNIISVFSEIRKIPLEKMYFGILCGRIRYSVIAGNGELEGTINAGCENDCINITHLYFYNRSGTVELNKLSLVRYFCEYPEIGSPIYKDVIPDFDVLTYKKVKKY